MKLAKSLNFVLILSLSLFLLQTVGCSSGEKTYPVSGSVTYKGKAVEQGAITFLSSDASHGSAIVDGRYTCEVSPGIKTVQITGSKRVKPKKGDDPSLVLYEDYIPKKYNLESSMTVDVQGMMEKNFDLD